MAIYTDQTIDGNFDPGAFGGTQAVTIVTMSIDDADDDGVIRADGGDQINGSDVTRVWVGDTIVLDGTLITGVTFYTADGGRYFTPSDGSVLADGTVTSTTFVNTSTQFPVSGLGPPCFVAGTLIDTADGPCAVEDLAPGDLVLTRDNGAQPVRWIGKRVVTGRGDFAPVRIAAGILGNQRDLFVSPQHRMLVQDWRAQMFLGEDEVLCPAVRLCNGDTIHRVPRDSVTYVHVMFDSHEIVFAEGAPSESFAIGDLHCANGSAAHRELAEIFPELDEMKQSFVLARRTARGFETEVMNAV